MNVLIVDDDARWAEFTGIILRPVVNKLRVAYTYAEALMTLNKANGFDVVMLDISLPDSPQAFTMDRIKDIKAGGRKVVLVTGQIVDDALRSEAMAHGASDVLYKWDLNFDAKLKLACT